MSYDYESDGYDPTEDRRGQYERPYSVGMDELKEGTPAGVCPMCGDPASKMRNGKFATLCNDEICVTAAVRYYRRSVRNRARARRKAAQIAISCVQLTVKL